PAFDGHRVGLWPEAKDGVVRELDPVRDAGGVEYEYIAVALAAGVELGQLEGTRDDALTVLRPLQTWVVHLIAVRGQLQLERKANRRAAGQPIGQVALEVIRRA